MAFVITSSVEALITILLAKVLILQPNLSLTLFLNSRYRVNCLFDLNPLFLSLLFNDSTALFRKPEMERCGILHNPINERINDVSSKISFMSMAGSYFLLPI